MGRQAITPENITAETHRIRGSVRGWDSRRARKRHSAAVPARDLRHSRDERGPRGTRVPAVALEGLERRLSSDEARDLVGLAHDLGFGMTDRYQQNPSVEAASLENEVILLDPETNQFCILNHTASVIWSRVAQPATSEEIAAEVSAQFAGVTEVDALRDVEEALRQLEERRLITRV
jgi:hypothetical protein